MDNQEKEVVLIERSDWQKIENNNAIQLVYGGKKNEKNTYVIQKDETLKKQISIITSIIHQNNITKVEIYDINNSMAILEVCKKLNITCIINVVYPINWVSMFAKYYFKYTELNNIQINYEISEYKKQYAKFFLCKNLAIDEFEKLEDLKEIISEYEKNIFGITNNLNQVQQFAHYLQNELNIYKASKTVKVAKLIAKPFKLFKKIVRKVGIPTKKIKNTIKYLKKYGIIKTTKKFFYKLKHNYDIPLWESDEKEHYQDLYEFKFFRYKKMQQQNLKISLKKLKFNYEKGLVSIVLPVYNGEDLLEEALDSIIKQTYKNFECIMVNDGSTDGSLKIMKKFAKKDKRFILIDQKNTKLPKALNNGFKLAKGEFYTWTSCDNNMHPQYIERMVKQLKQDKNVDFIYADLRLIDEKSNILKGFGWHEIPENSGNVILPDNINHLNIYPNNYIGAAFMYRSAVHKILSDYSVNRYTVEDYDYWQRINDLFKIKKARLSEPLYYYRFHSKSLTAQTKELKINDKRDEMMIYDDFRRDFYLMPICWVIDYDSKSKNLYKKLKKALINKKQLLLSKEQINQENFPKNYSNVIYLNLTKNLTKKINKEIFYGNLIKENRRKLKFNYNHYNENEYEISSTTEEILKMVEIMAKDYYSIQYENKLYKKQEKQKDLSIVICTYNRNEQLEESIISAINQTENKKNYEILVINNNIESQEVKELVINIRKKYKLKEDFLKYYVAPIKGLSYARNVGMWEATGKYILYIDDDSVCDKDIVKETIKAFEDNPNAGVIGGNIILRVPQNVSNIYLPQYAGLWSQYKVEGNEYIKINNWYGYPYGANISILRSALLTIGGFKIAYGRRENDFAGGEEIVISSLINKIGKEIIINPKSKVEHAVEINRFSKEHIKHTACSGLFTWYRLYLDMYIDEIVGINDINYKIEMINEKYKKNLDEIEKYYVDSEKDAANKLKDYFYEIDSMRNIKIKK